ncbi:choice-of-anchor B family protein [Pseudoalteromonas sp. MMG024]|uniref:choice-of-anchor B family protein n=1 Tax=Pseudoalteromonas sp. MMG024 TaxID=2909980 RepID=UPI001F1B0089|nr:choice-of-anchor B family protein [Pseudoalteromonas sp. MMG024]MCF6456434.1 choice-of-anchor B family protein [Pseudoalteromonas sp. MMG024]
MMTQKLTLLTLALASSITSLNAIAHTEHDKARYVTENGIDKGDCNNPVRPCKSIAYGVSQASKGDKVLVASGQYELKNESELFYLQSELVPVLGGFNRFDHFQVQNPNRNKTQIVGAPIALHDMLQKAGFNVIADTKSLTISKQLKQKLARHQALFEQQSSTACVNGRAGSYSCNNVDLVAHVPLPANTSGNDIWGHVDLNNGIEYAIMGFSDGIRVYSLADPTNPTLVGRVAGANTTWRDIKVLQYYDETLKAYQAYAYVTAEANTGVQIINLNNLPTSVSLSGTNFTVSSAHNVYVSNVDYSLNLPLNGQSAKMQIVGSNKYGGSFTTYDLTTPSNPSKSFDIGSTSRANYTHDATSMSINDTRATRDCVNATSGVCDVFIDFNENEIRIWDATQSANTERLGQVGYDDVDSSSQYVHSGWWHENKRYVYVHDEFDENKGGLNTTVRILDLADLTQPTIVGKWTSNNRTIDHNGFVKGNRYYMSNYERGLTILDISDPINPQEVGYFDTFPTSDNPSFNGAWGAYPYLPSGNILISDINSGLYVLKDNTRDNNVNVAFENTELIAERSDELRLVVTKPSAVSDEASVEFEIINGSALLDSDMNLRNSSQTLTWAANDTTPKVIGMALTDNGETSLKDFYIRLHNASGNLEIGDNRIMKVTINGLASQGKVGFVQTSRTFSEKTGDVNIELSRMGGSRGQITFDYQVEYLTASSNDISFENGTVTWAEGDTANKTIAFSITDDQEIEGAERFIIKLTNNDDSLLSNQQIEITISDDDSNSAPEVYAGNDIELATNASTVLNAATASDDRTEQLNYQWQFVSGVAINITNADSLTPSVSASSEAGTAVISFTATDEHGASSSDELIITVVAPVIPVGPPVPEESSSSSGSLPIYLLLLMSLLAIRRR